MELTPATLAAVFNAFNTKFQTAYKEPEVVWDQIADLMPSATSQETYAWMAPIGALRKWLGERQVKNLQGRAQVLVNDKYEDTIGVKREHIEDDTIGLYAPRIMMLGRESKKWPDQLVSTAIANGLTVNCFDGNPFFYNAHPIDTDNPSGSTYQNRFDSSANGGGIGFPMTADNVATILQTMMTYTGEDGLPLFVMPKLLLVPPNLLMRAKQICESDIIAQAFGSNVAQAQSNVLKGMLKPVVNPYLTDTNRYYLIAPDMGIKPFIFQLRNAPELTPMDQLTSENVFHRDEFLYGVRARGAAGTTLPFLCATGST